MKYLLFLAITICLMDFSEADQSSARQEQPQGPSKAAPSLFKNVLKEKLVILKDQQMAIHEIEQEPKLYVFYFSAHWCPPCRAFTPALVEFYNGHPGKGRDFEIIFVSDDSDAAAMVTYMKEMAMPWPAVGYKLGPRLWEVRKYRGAGIPCLVVVDHQGKVLSDSYRNGEYVGPMRVLQDLQALTRKAR